MPYILHAALLLSVCLVFYKLLLQKETHYRLNRLVLLVCLGLSFSLPLLPVPGAWSLRSAPADNAITVVTPATNAVSPAAPLKTETAKAPVSNAVQEAPLLPRVLKWAFYLYWLGVAAFGLNLLLQIVVLMYQAYTKPVLRDGPFRIIELDNDKAPCSFGRSVFINPAKYEWETYSQILLHEKVHIRQGHSFDILLAELVVVFQWFNPLAWLYRKELENNLEFLTDDVVLRHNEVEKESYQLSLLKVSASHLPLSITTNYNQSLLKKRIIMMNATRSNIHTMWKYFILIPVLGVLVCALNRPVTVAQSPVAKAENAEGHNNRSEGYWFATIKNDKVHFEFRDEEEDHNRSSSTTLLLSELPALPRNGKGEFSLQREAGNMLFTGKFEGNQGYGQYKFTPDEAYKAHMTREGITGIKEDDHFAFFMVNIRKAYVTMLKENGFSTLNKQDLIAMAALKIDAPYIKFWKENGYKPSAHELVAAKSLNIDAAYVSEISKAGYKNLSVNDLIAFKSQGINGAYISGLRKANLKAGKKDEDSELSAGNITAFKSLNIDTAYIMAMESVGLSNLSFSDLTAMKSLNITPAYVKSMTDMGYKDVPAHMLVAFKSQDISPAFIKRFESAGYKNIPLNDLITIKSLDITPAYIKSFEEVGYSNISIRDLIPLKSLGITPAYIKGFNNLGFNNIPLRELPALKSTGVTPEYVTDMKKKGFNSTDLGKYIQLRTAFNN